MTRLRLMSLFAAAMSLFLIGMTTDHARKRAAGREVVLEVRPVDPRDLFLGHYAIINTALGRLNTADLAGDDDFAAGGHAGEDIYVALEESGGIAAPVAVYRQRPDSGLYIRGKIRSVSRNWHDDGAPAAHTLHARFNIERYFASPRRAREIEDRVAARSEDDIRPHIILAVSPSGDAIIKGIEIDGERYEERLW